MDSSNEYVNVNILFFAKAKELVKQSSMKLKLPSTFKTMDLLLEKVEKEIPQLKILNRWQNQTTAIKRPRVNIVQECHYLYEVFTGCIKNKGFICIDSENLYKQDCIC